MNEHQKGDGERCGTDGSAWPYSNGQCATRDVLDEVAEERASQFAEYGDNSGMRLGMGPEFLWLKPFGVMGAAVVEQKFRENYEQYEKIQGQVTWMHLIREEVAEAFAEADPGRLREELIQVAALCVSCIENLDAGTVQR